MFWTRLYRKTDWGFMGDDVGTILFTKGPYAITRHPYYLGSITFGFGIYLILNSWLIIMMVPVILFIRNAIKNEENFMKDKFGQEWIIYHNKVNIIPWF